MIVYKTQAQASGYGPLVWTSFQDVLIGLADIYEEMSVGDTFTLEIAEMTQEEYDNLPEFEGY